MSNCQLSFWVCLNCPGFVLSPHTESIHPHPHHPHPHLLAWVISLGCWRGKLCKGAVWIINAVTRWGRVDSTGEVSFSAASTQSSGGKKTKTTTYCLNSVPPIWGIKKELWLSASEVFVPRRWLGSYFLLVLGSVQKYGEQWAARCKDKSPKNNLSGSLVWLLQTLQTGGIVCC